MPRDDKFGRALGPELFRRRCDGEEDKQDACVPSQGRDIAEGIIIVIVIIIVIIVYSGVEEGCGDCRGCSVRCQLCG